MTPKLNRSLITKIRISAHQLAIETGRYMKHPLPVPERFCKNCKNKVEDEKHFILYCPLYKNKLVGTYSYFSYERPIKFRKIKTEILF
jgi:hypothetical protein